MIHPARDELLALAATARGEDWADDLSLAVAAATNAGWDWPRIGQFASRLIFTDQASPRDLTEAARNPLERAQSAEPNADWAAARKALAARDGAA